MEMEMFEWLQHVWNIPSVAEYFFGWCIKSAAPLQKNIQNVL